MDIFDEELFNQMEPVSVQPSKCITQNDLTIIFMFIYVLDLFLRFIRKQNWFTLRNVTYYVEQFIIRNLKNGSEDDVEEHTN